MRTKNKKKINQSKTITSKKNFNITSQKLKVLTKILEEHQTGILKLHKLNSEICDGKAYTAYYCAV